MDIENYSRDFPHVAPAPLNFTATPDTIRQAANEAIDVYQSAVDKLIEETTPPETATFGNFIEPLAHADNRLIWAHNMLQVYELSGDAALRKAVDEAVHLFEDAEARTSMREDLFVRVDVVYQWWRGKEGEEKLDPEQTRFLVTLHEQLVSRGAALPPSTPERQRLLAIHKRLREIEDQFEDKLAMKEPRKLWLTRKECEGLPPSLYLSATWGTTDETRGRVSVPLRAFVMEQARHAHVRRELFDIWAQPCRENVPLFIETLRLREEAAALVGFPHYVDLVMKQEQRMARTVEAVEKCLVDLLQTIQPLAETAASQLLQCKRADLASRASDDDENEKGNEENEEIENELHDWDIAYYQRKLVYERTSVTPEEIMEYLPLEHVLDAVLAIVSELYGLAFEEIPRRPNDRLAWHEHVRILSLRDNGEMGGGFVGHIYLDLFRREGKRRGIWCRGISQSHLLPTNTRVYPAAALVCDFVKTPADEPQLLTYDQPVQLLHELGHSIHEVVSRTRYARFHGASGTAIDFGEAHGLLLEKWFFLNEAGIRRLTRHYSTLSPTPTPTPTPTSTPDKIVQAIITYQKVYCGPLFHLDQLIMAKFDLDSHLAPSAAQNTKNSENTEIDADAIFHTLRSTFYPKSMSVDSPTIPPQHDYTKNGRLFTEYAAGYYAYYWADIYASDVFDSYFRSAIDTFRQGYRYRKTVLEKGGSMDGTQIFHAYLKREVQTKALYNQLVSSVLR